MSPEQKLDAAVKHVGGQRPDAALQALAAAARAELKQAPVVRAWWVDAAVVLGLNLLMGVTGAAVLQWNLTQHTSALSRDVVAVVWLAFMSAASWAWLKPGRDAIRWGSLAFFIGASALALVGLSGDDRGFPFWSGIGCAFTECAFAFIPTVAVVGFSTRFAARPLQLFIGTLAASVGGTVALHFHCPNGSWAHVAAFHLLPAVLLGGVAVLVRRALRSRTFVP